MDMIAYLKLRSTRFKEKQMYSRRDYKPYRVRFEGLERLKEVLRILLDLFNAFDCVHHKVLLQKLEGSGVCFVALEWIKSYLGKINQCVQIANALSTKLNITNGVPQKSILGPVLFLITI